MIGGVFRLRTRIGIFIPSRERRLRMRLIFGRISRNGSLVMSRLI